MALNICLGANILDFNIFVIIVFPYTHDTGAVIGTESDDEFYTLPFISSHLSPLALEVIGAPQMTLQQYLSILPCLSLPSGNLQTPFPSIP